MELLLVLRATGNNGSALPAPVVAKVYTTSVNLPVLLLRVHFQTVHFSKILFTLTMAVVLIVVFQEENWLDLLLG